MTVRLQLFALAAMACAHSRPVPEPPTEASILALEHFPFPPKGVGHIIDIEATVVAPGGVTDPVLLWSLDGAPFKRVAMHRSGEDYLVRAEIPIGGAVDYCLMATDARTHEAFYWPSRMGAKRQLAGGSHSLVEIMRGDEKPVPIPRAPRQCGD